MKLLAKVCEVLLILFMGMWLAKVWTMADDISAIRKLLITNGCVHVKVLTVDKINFEQ